MIDLIVEDRVGHTVGERVTGQLSGHRAFVTAVQPSAPHAQERVRVGRHSSDARRSDEIAVSASISSWTRWIPAAGSSEVPESRGLA